MDLLRTGRRRQCSQSILQPLSVAGSEGPPPQVSWPTVSGELDRLSEEFRPPSLAGEYKQVTVLCGGLADAWRWPGVWGLRRCIDACRRCSPSSNRCCTTMPGA